MLLLLGFAGARRRSELAPLDTAELRGQRIAIERVTESPYCEAGGDSRMMAAEIQQGPISRRVNKGSKANEAWLSDQASHMSS